MAVQHVNLPWSPIRYICEAGDTKPLKADPGALLYVTDTPGHFIWDGTEWKVYLGAGAITP